MRLGRMLSVGEVVDHTTVEEPAVETPTAVEAASAVEPTPVTVDEPVTASR